MLSLWVQSHWEICPTHHSFPLHPHVLFFFHETFWTTLVCILGLVFFFLFHPVMTGGVRGGQTPRSQRSTDLFQLNTALWRVLSLGQCAWEALSCNGNSLIIRLESHSPPSVWPVDKTIKISARGRPPTYTFTPGLKNKAGRKDFLTGFTFSWDNNYVPHHSCDWWVLLTYKYYCRILMHLKSNKNYRLILLKPHINIPYNVPGSLLDFDITRSSHPNSPSLSPKSPLQKRLRQSTHIVTA